MSCLEDADLELLIETAYLGLNNGFLNEASVIFHGLRSLRPDNPHPIIGLALMHYSRRQTLESIRLLEGLLETFPEAVFTRALLAQLMKEAGLVGWETYAHQAIKLDERGMASEIAQSLLDGREVGQVKPVDHDSGDTFNVKSATAEAFTAAVSAGALRLRRA